MFCMLFFVEITVFGVLLILLLIFSILVSLKTIIPYTPIAKKQIDDATDKAGDILKLLIHNVYQYNTEYDKLLELIKEQSPDVILLLETGIEWDRATQSLKSDYPYVVKEIRENTYGIIMMTRLPVLEGGINHLVSEEIPSAEMLVKVGEQQVRILGIHPEPPLPGHASTSIPKEKEILASATYLSTKLNLDHAILAGDLNDVA